MRAIKWVRWLWVATLVAALAQVVWYYDQLPPQVASHFDFEGHANDWTSRDEFVLVWILLILFMNGMAAVVRPLMNKLPDRLISVPRRDYWCANPERRRQMVELVGTMMFGVFAAVNVMLIISCQHIYDFNLHGHSDGHPWLGLIIILLATFGLSIWLVVSLSRPPKAT